MNQKSEAADRYNELDDIFADLTDIIDEIRSVEGSASTVHQLMLARAYVRDLRGRR